MFERETRIGVRRGEREGVNLRWGGRQGGDSSLNLRGREGGSLNLTWTVWPLSLLPHSLSSSLSSLVLSSRVLLPYLHIFRFFLSLSLSSTHLFSFVSSFYPHIPNATTVLYLNILSFSITTTTSTSPFSQPITTSPFPPTLPPPPPPSRQLRARGGTFS